MRISWGTMVFPLKDSLAALSLLFAFSAGGAIRYVDGNSSQPTEPYTSWDTAAVTVQDAVDAAQAGDEIVVTNGVYASGGKAVSGSMTNRVAIDKAVWVHSVNGAAFTLIVGQQLPGTTNGDGAVRCMYVTNGASISGFTLTNGATRAGGNFTRE